MRKFLEFKKDFVKLVYSFRSICHLFNYLFRNLSDFSGVSHYQFCFATDVNQPIAIIKFKLLQLTSQEIIALIEFIFAGIQLILFIRIIRMFHFIAEKSHDINLDRTY